MIYFEKLIDYCELGKIILPSFLESVFDKIYDTSLENIIKIANNYNKRYESDYDKIIINFFNKTIKDSNYYIKNCLNHNKYFENELKNNYSLKILVYNCDKKYFTKKIIDMFNVFVLNLKNKIELYNKTNNDSYKKIVLKEIEFISNIIKDAIKFK